MATRTFVSRFSPNRTEPSVLEAIFVQRQQLAEVWHGKLRDSALSGTKHHLLAVGPRGCGKSHLVALLVSRLRSDPVVRDRIRVAWLPEDETTPSFWKFLLRILRALNAEYKDDFPLPPRDELSDTSNDRRATFLIDYLVKKLEGRTLLVVIENLDDAMRGLKDEGQKRWRAFLQEHAICATLATAQQLTDDISKRGQPFFGFFQLAHLQPLAADEAISLLQKIAVHSQDADLIAFLRAPTGRARVRAIRHLAGGSHRVFIILSEFATREKLDDLVLAFEELLDELTPYYQERLRWLPKQQREIVEMLCRQARTVAVKEIAAELYMGEQTVASQLKSLKDKGYVLGESVGRESRYELTEPLMRLCVEVKDPQREPIRLIVAFLRVWYDRPQVEAKLRQLAADETLERRYLAATLQNDSPPEASLIQLALSQDLERARAKGDREALVEILLESAVTSEDTKSCVTTARELMALGRNEEALEAFDRATTLDPNSLSAWVGKGLLLIGLRQPKEALEVFDRAITLDPDDTAAQAGRGLALALHDRVGEALEAFDRAIALDPDAVPLWRLKANVLAGLLGRNEEALAAYDQATRLEPNEVSDWKSKGLLLVKLNRTPEALAAFDQATVLQPDDEDTWRMKGKALLDTNRFEESVAAFERAITLKPDDVATWVLKGGGLYGLRRAQDALEAFDHAIALKPEEPHVWMCRGLALTALDRGEEALAAYDRATTLKPDHFSAWMEKGLALTALDRGEEALAAYDQATTLKPDDAAAWALKGSVLADLEQHAEALSALERALALAPEDAEAWMKKGYELGALDRHDEAVNAFRRVTVLDPAEIDGWVNVGYMLNAVGQYAEAAEVSERAITIDPNYSFGWKNRGRARLGLGRSHEAVADLQHAVKLDEANAQSLECLAEALILADAWGEAETALKRRFALPRSGDNPARSWHLPDVITAVPRASADRDVWHLRAERFVEIATSANAIADLSESLVRSLTRSAFREIAPDIRNGWAQVWGEIAKQNPALALAARLFGVGVRYLQTKDERVLLDLLQEERAILRDLFGLDSTDRRER